MIKKMKEKVTRTMGKVSEKILSKKPGDNNVVVVMLLIVVGVALVLIFKNGGTTLINNLMADVTTEVNSWF